MAAWEKKEIQVLIDNYPHKGKMWCCRELGKTEGQVRDKAYRLGLKQNTNSVFFKDWQKRAAMSKVGKKRPEHSKVMSLHMEQGRLHNVGLLETSIQKSERLKEWHKNNPHPRGMKDKKHSKETKKAVSEASIAMWKNPQSKVNSPKNRQRMSDIMSKRQSSGKARNRYSNGRMGTYNVNGVDYFFRSLWEVNYALYLDFLIDKNQIMSWKYESKTFWFEAIRRGVRSYKPDFEVTLLDHSTEFHEVKGWMDAKSKTKLKRMAKYHPDVKMILIDKKPYMEILKKLKGIIKFYT